jgi:WG containing repeat
LVKKPDEVKTQITKPVLRKKCDEDFIPFYSSDYILHSNGQPIFLAGFKNKNGEIVIKPKFQNVRPFTNGIAYVQILNKNAFINYKGEIIDVYWFFSKDIHSAKWNIKFKVFPD